MKNLLTPIALALAVTPVRGETTVIEERLWSGVPVIQAGGVPNYEVRGQGDRTDRWTTDVSDPILTIYQPDRATGAACLVFPGGGYGGLSLDKEGHYVAKWLAERGVVGVVAPYRCGGGKHQHPVPMLDANRAIRVTRANADRWGIEADQIGVMGFSAGGHLAATVATRGPRYNLLAEDNLSRVSDKVDFAVLVYPVISMREGVTHSGSSAKLLGQSPDDRDRHKLSADEQVTAVTPPTLLIHAIDDQAVPVENSQRFYDACREKGVPVEMHLYETGGHGFGMWAGRGSVSRWPEALEAWLVGRGLAKR